MKTIAQQLNVKKFPFKIKDENNNEIYVEYSNVFWIKCEYDKNNNQLYLEDSNGFILDNRPKKCTDKVVTIDGVDYELKEIKK